MADYKVLAEVGESLIGVIWQGIQADPALFALINNPDLISLQSPVELEDDNDPALLSVYLYRVAEDPYLKNQPASTLTGTGGQLHKAPMALELSYLITPLLNVARDRQIVLGKIMQLLYDRPYLEGGDLLGSLGADSPLRIVFNSLSADDMYRLWHAVGSDHRLSVTYTVRVSLLESTRQWLVQPVVERDTTYAGKSARQPAEAVNAV